VKERIPEETWSLFSEPVHYIWNKTISYTESKISDEEIDTDGRFEGVEKTGEARQPAVRKVRYWETGLGGRGYPSSELRESICVWPPSVRFEAK
jgi:hypothetical protein